MGEENKYIQLQIKEIVHADDKSIDGRFRKFDQENPQVWELFKKYTLEVISAGRKHFSSDAITHRIRWYTFIETKSDDGFKISDHFTSRYARKFNKEFPQYNYLFELRTLK